MIKTLQNMLNLDYKLDRLLSHGKNEKSNSINEISIRRKNHDKIFWTESINL